MPLPAAEAAKRLVEFQAPTIDDKYGFADELQNILGIEGGSWYGTKLPIAAARAVKMLSILTRGAIMKKLAGKLRPVAESAVKMDLNLPYQTGETRLPFRSTLVGDAKYLGRGKVLVACNQLKRLYDQPVEWFAEWCAYIEGSLFFCDLDLVLSVAIDSGNETVFSTLVQSMEGKHPIGAPSAVGIRALLRCKRPDAWPIVQKMLLQAERQEGLRQKIVECADELSPDAFKKVLKTLVEHNLFRFSSVIRSFIMWFPGLIDEKKPASAEKVVMRLIEFLEDPRLEPQRTYPDVYLRLWADAYFEASDAIKRAEAYASDSDVEVRRAASELVSKIALSTAYPMVRRFLSDDSHRVAAPAIRFISEHLYGNKEEFQKPFHDAVLFAARRWPKDGKDSDGIDRKKVWDIALHLSTSSLLEFYCDNMAELSADGRYHLAHTLLKTADAKLARKMYVKFAGDGSSTVRSAAFTALSKVKLEQGEVVELETLLTRKAADLRTSLIKLLSNQKLSLVEASADRLLASEDPNQKKAGEELAKELAKKGVKAYASAPGKTEDQESVDSLSRYDLLGLVKTNELTWAKKPDPVPGLVLFSDETVRFIGGLDNYIHSRKDELTKPTNRYRFDEGLIGELTAEDIVPWTGPNDELPGNLSPFVTEVFEWLNSNESNLAVTPRILLRSRIICDCCDYASNQIRKGNLGEFKKHFKVIPRHISCIKGIVNMLARSNGFDIGEMLDFLADSIALVANDTYAYRGHVRLYDEESWRNNYRIKFLTDLLIHTLTYHKFDLGKDQAARAFCLLRYYDEPLGESKREAINKLQKELDDEPIEYYIMYSDRKEKKTFSLPLRRRIHPLIMDRFYSAGVCSEADVIDQASSELAFITNQPGKFSKGYSQAMQKLVDRIVWVESKRGELPGPATALASQVHGFLQLRHVLQVLEKGVELARASSYEQGDISRPKSFSILLKHSRPGTEDTLDACKSSLKGLKINPERLIELAVLAPAWSAAVESALGWQGLEDAAWWFHAHTKDTSYRTEDEKTKWFSFISERTPLSAAQLENGACDPAWFHRFRAKLTDKQWKQLDKCAKFASDGTGHARAQLFAKALQSQLTMAEIADNIKSKRNPNYVRALGLLPLGDNPDQEVRERYAVLQEFLAGSKQFGSQKRETEKLAFEIAMDNLASTAGYPDALRLTWSLEAAEVADMKDGITVTEGDVTVRLAFDDLGIPEIAVEKAGKQLKEIPAALKKLPAIKELTLRRTQLKKQLVRMRAALEQAMQRGDTFSANELQGLLEHPGLKPLLQSLVFISESGLADFALSGSPLLDEKGWLRIAHPHDLLQRGDWPEWQRRVFLEERIQPFKQVFRELYVPTESEKAQDRVSRYGGHQVQPNRAIGILQKRGWIARYEEGVTKTDHKLGITAHLVAEFNLYTPADIEGVTLDALFFSKAGSYDPIPLAEIPPVLFSETMRDLDLVVSVASSTGFDPEASESTIEMRRHVVEQTASLLRLDNISFLERHVAIQGKLAEYRVHLGSAAVQQLAKGELVIVAVRQPQRGRLFLPFVDDDPRTAELVSKVILLARDDEIKDPSILGQIIG